MALHRRTFLFRSLTRCLLTASLLGQTPVAVHPGPTGESGQAGCADASNCDILSTGADPTGVADSTAPIQHAIDYVASNGGGTVKLPKGKYLLNSYHPSTHPWMFYNLRVPSNVFLEAKPGAILLQGHAGRAPLQKNATYVENDVLVFGTINYKHNTFQDAAYNGGFYSLEPTTAGASSVSLVRSEDAVHFSPGDYVGIYASTEGDVIPSEMTQLASVNVTTGALLLTKPLARSFAHPAVANVTSLATIHVGMRNLAVQGTVPLLLTEVFDFAASHCVFIYDGAVGGGNIVTPMVANTVRGFRMEYSGFMPQGSVYAHLELPQRNSQDIFFDHDLFQVKDAGMGEYAAHWKVIQNRFLLVTDPSITVGLAFGGQDVEATGNDITGALAANGNGSGALIADMNGPVEYAEYLGGFRFRDNTVACRADGNNCMTLRTKDPEVSGNYIKVTGSAVGIKVEGSRQAAVIKNNRISVGPSWNIILNSAITDASAVTGNYLSGSGSYAIYVASPASPQAGALRILDNFVNGPKNEVFIDTALHPGSIVQ